MISSPTLKEELICKLHKMNVSNKVIRKILAVEKYFASKFYDLQDNFVCFRGQNKSFRINLDSILVTKNK